MAHQLHERTSSHIECRKDGRRSKLYVISTDPLSEVARRWRETGHETDLVTEKTTWRGQNGKRTTVELSRTPLTDTGDA